MIDVFICTYNPKHDVLKRTIDAILQQHLDKQLWGFTIIDNNSSVPVKDLAFIKEQNINVISEQTPGLTAARQCAANNATGEIIVFVDDDNVLDSDYLFWVNDAFKDPDIGILSGAIFPEYAVQPSKWVLKHEEMLAIKKIDGDKIMFNSSKQFGDLFPTGAGMAIKTTLLINYFEENSSSDNLIQDRKGTDLSSCGDLDIDFYALYKGYKIGCFPKMKMIHIIPEGRTTLNYLNNLSISALTSSALVNKKWIPVFKQNIFYYFDFNINTILRKIIINKIGGVFDKTRYMRSTFFSALYKLKKDNSYIN